jgi:hypothetical protein
MDAFNQSAFERHFGTAPEKYYDVSRLMEVMCCALEPMPMGDLADMLGSTQEAVEGGAGQLRYTLPRGWGSPLNTRD